VGILGIILSGVVKVSGKMEQTESDLTTLIEVRAVSDYLCYVELRWTSTSFFYNQVDIAKVKNSYSTPTHQPIALDWWNPQAHLAISQIYRIFLLFSRLQLS